MFSADPSDWFTVPFALFVGDSDVFVAGKGLAGAMPRNSPGLVGLSATKNAAL
jgi:hypothetical protein